MGEGKNKNKNNNNNNNNSDINSGIITQSSHDSNAHMITKLNEWKELYINDVEVYSVRVGEVEEAVTVLNDFIMYVKYLD